MTADDSVFNVELVVFLSLEAALSSVVSEEFTIFNTSFLFKINR